MKRFWDKVEKTDSCWIWLAGKDTAGYGQFRFNGRNDKAHRVSYFLEHGKMPNFCRHICDNPACVNPEHLRDGSHTDNMSDMYDRERNYGIKKSEVEDIRKIPMSNTILFDVSQKYDISMGVARDVITGQVWSRLPGARELVRQKTRGKLSLDDIKEIKTELQNPWRGQVNALAEKYGVRHSHISHIKHGRIHSDVSI